MKIPLFLKIVVRPQIMVEFDPKNKTLLMLTFSKKFNPP